MIFKATGAIETDEDGRDGRIRIVDRSSYWVSSCLAANPEPAFRTRLGDASNSFWEA